MNHEAALNLFKWTELIMLIKNTFERNKAIGDLYLIPGVNQVDEKRWANLLKGKFGKPIRGLLEDGELEILNDGSDDGKITIKMIKETYDIDLLNEWLDDAKGRIKGAINKQIEMLEEGIEKEE
jgi:hypothetical protein